MKLHSTLLASALLAGAAGTAKASSADLMVIGNIVPAACSIAMQNGGLIDFGILDLATLNHGTPTTLAPRTLRVTVQCPSPAKVVTLATENRVGTAYVSGNEYFGLGRTSKNISIGHYTVVADSGLADSVVATVIGSSNVSTWSTQVGGVPVHHTGNRYTSLGSTSAGPVALQRMEWVLRMLPTIAPVNTLFIEGQESVDGEMTLTLVYL